MGPSAGGYGLEASKSVALLANSLVCTAWKAAKKTASGRRGKIHCRRQDLIFKFQTIMLTLCWCPPPPPKVVMGRMPPASRVLCRPGLVTFPTALLQIYKYCVIKNDATVMLLTSKRSYLQRKRIHKFIMRLF
jgi:hypothetical protein